jgi:chromosome segregation ATPase
MINTEEENEIIKSIKDIQTGVSSLNNTLAIQAAQLIDLRAEISEFQSDQKATRLFRAQVEGEQLEAEIGVLKKRMDAMKNNIPITDKIKRLVRGEVGEVIQSEFRKSQIDWVAVRQVAVQTAAGSLVVALVWVVIRLLAGGAMP